MATEHQDPSGLSDYARLFRSRLDSHFRSLPVDLRFLNFSLQNIHFENPAFSIPPSFGAIGETICRPAFHGLALTPDRSDGSNRPPG